MEWVEILEQLWRAGGDERDLDEAQRLLSSLLEGAPQDRREAMAGNVPMHSRIREAWESR